jgi:hypothetical protein
LISRFVNKCSLNITRHSSLSSSRNLTTCHTRGESKLFYFIVMFSPKVCNELDFISLNSASQIIPSVDMRVSCYKELKCRCREVREKVEGQQYTRVVRLGVRVFFRHLCSPQGPRATVNGTVPWLL